MNEKLDLRRILAQTILAVLPTFAFFILAISGFGLLSKIFWASIMTLFTALLFVQSLLAERAREKQLDSAKDIILKHFHHYLDNGYAPVDIRDHLEHWLQHMRQNDQILRYEYHQLHVFLGQIYSTSVKSGNFYRKEIEESDRIRKNLSTHHDDTPGSLSSDDTSTMKNQES